MEKLLLITRNFPPLWGGMEHLNWHMADEMAKGGRVRCVAPAGAAVRKPPSVELTEVPLSPLPRFLLQATWAGTRLARSWKPDLILAGSGLCAPSAWLAARAAGSRSAAYLHGLDVAVPSRSYRWLWLPFLRRLDGIVANSRATAELALRAGVSSSRLRVVHPGVKLEPEDALRRARVREKLGWGNRPLLLFVGRLIRRKGLLDFIANSFPQVVAQHHDCLLLVVGESPRHALRAEPVSPAVIRATARRVGVEGQVSILGPRFGEELSDIFRAVDVHVFPVLDLPGDPEGFGMVSIEAAACGVPTVAFPVGGVAEAVGDGLSGRLAAIGDWEGFAAAVNHYLDRRADPQIRAACLRFARDFAWENFGERLRAALDSFSR